MDHVSKQLDLMWTDVIHTETEQIGDVYKDTTFTFKPKNISQKHPTDVKCRYLSESDALEKNTGEIYKHYKGGVYRLLQSDVKCAEESGVVYEHLYPHGHNIYFRPQDMFFGELPDGSKRFTLIQKQN